MQKMSDKCYHL